MSEVIGRTGLGREACRGVPWLKNASVFICACDTVLDKWALFSIYKSREKCVA